MDHPAGRNAREMTYDETMSVVLHLQQSLVSGKLAYGTITATAGHFNLHRNCVANLWKAFCRRDMTPKEIGRVGRKARYTNEEITTMATGLSLCMLNWSLKSGTLTRRSSRLKPLLTTHNVLDRLATAEVEFCGMWDVVHLDTKWFNADKDRRKVYLTAGEEPLRRACKSKRFVPKVMFLAAVARPRFDACTGRNFDGKIGMWPFVVHAPAQRNSRNRPAGTMVSTLVNVTGPTYRDFVLNKVVPAIKASFPSGSRRVILQHDNATPHRSIDDAALRGVSTDWWTFIVRRQPANSPDLNVLDLGFFASIQALQYKVVSRSVDDVIVSTMNAFDMLSAEKLESVFLTLQAVMRLVLVNHGGNHYKLPHLMKDTLRRAGTLMTNVTCPASLLQQVDLELLAARE